MTQTNKETDPHVIGWVVAAIGAPGSVTTTAEGWFVLSGAGFPGSHGLYDKDSALEVAAAQSATGVVWLALPVHDQGDDI